MERGDRSIALAVLGVIAVVSALASVAVYLKQPTGQVIYVTEEASHIGIFCRDRAAFLGYTGNYAVYCCLEHMIGQNECKFPQRIFRTS